MFHYYWTGYYHDDGYYVGNVYVLVDGETYQIKHFTGWDTWNVQENCIWEVLDRDGM